MDIQEFSSRPVRKVRDLAELLGTGINGTYKAVKDGTYPSIRQGNRILIPTAPIVAMLGSAPCAPKSAGEDDAQY